MTPAVSTQFLSDAFVTSPTFHVNGGASVLRIERFFVTDLKQRVVPEYRVVERDATSGDFIGYHAFGDQNFADSVLAQKVRAAYSI